MSKPRNEDCKYLLASDGKGSDIFPATMSVKDWNAKEAVLTRLFISPKK